MSTSGSWPESRIMLRARSRIRTGSPISSTKISDPLPMTEACRTNCTASGMVMKYRRISGCVIVTGPPRAICCLKMGTTLPLLPSTFPKRTETNFVPFSTGSLAWIDTINSVDALREPHHVRGIHRLVRGDHHEGAHAVAIGGVHHVVEPDHVVGDGFDHIVLHHRHVLVSGRVVDGGDAVLPDDFFHAVVVANVADHRANLYGRRHPEQFHLDLEQIAFRLVQRDEILRFKTNELPAQLGSDGSAGAGNQYRRARRRSRECGRAPAELVRVRAGSPPRFRGFG